MKVYEVNHATNASGKAYVLSWKAPSGRRTQKYANPDDALTEARLKASQLATGRIEGAEMTMGDRDELQAARRLANGTPLLAAMEEWSRARQLTHGNILPAAQAWAAHSGTATQRIKVREAVKEFLKAKTAAGKNVEKDHGATFKRVTSDMGDFYLDSVSAKQLDAWLAQWDNPGTRNTRRKRIVSIWRWSQRKGYLPRDVRTEAEMTDTAHEPAPVIGIIGVQTWKDLLAHFRQKHPGLLPALVLAGFCGLRRSEIHAQRWEDISLERRNVRVSYAKRGTPSRRMVPLCAAAVEWLTLCGDRKGYICPTVEYDGAARPSLAIDGIRRISREAKLPRLPENCFRHSYISHKVAATGDIARVSLDAGNSPKEINRHYRELVSEQEGLEWFNVSPPTIAGVISIAAAS